MESVVGKSENFSFELIFSQSHELLLDPQDQRKLPVKEKFTGDVGTEER